MLEQFPNLNLNHFSRHSGSKRKYYELVERRVRGGEAEEIAAVL